MAENRIESLYQLFERGAQLFGDKSAFRFNSSEGENSVSYKDYNNYLDKATVAFHHLGITGKRVILIGETSIQWITSYVATVTCGGVIVPLDPYLLEDEIIKFVNKAKAEFIVCSKSFENLFSERKKEIGKVKKVILIDRRTFALEPTLPYTEAVFCPFESIISLGTDLIQTNGESVDYPKNNPSEMSALLFTSGTTGSSKGVMLSEKNICTVVNSIYPTLYQLNTTDTLLSVLPVYHTYEMSCGILAPIMFGCTIAISDGIKYVGKNMKQFSPTVMTIVPLFANQIYRNILRSAQKQGQEKALAFGIALSNTLKKVNIDIRKKIFANVLSALGGKLKYFVVGGAALDPKMVDNFATFGITVSQGYGITECAPLISVVPFDVYNPTSCGKLITGMQLYIDKEKSDDAYGEIVVKGDNVMLGYYGDEEETKKVLSNGWFRTGDYGYIDDNGYIYITGRKKNVIVLPGGKNVFPEELEEYLQSVPLIEECVVVGRDNAEEKTTTVVALVYPNEEECKKRMLSDNEEIQKAITDEVQKINKKLASYKRINSVEVQNEPFEKTTTKKIKRYKVNQSKKSD